MKILRHDCRNRGFLLMQLKLKQGRGIEILIAHKNYFFFLSQCIILIFVKVKQLCEWEEEHHSPWDYSAYRQRVGSVLSCFTFQGSISSSPTLCSSRATCASSLPCARGPWHHGLLLKSRICFQSARTTGNLQTARRKG